MQWKSSQTLVDYPEAIRFMEDRVAGIHAGQESDLIWLLEHTSLYTAGTSAKAADLLEARFPVHDTGRGGQYTYHGPGQRVAYVMRNLPERDLRAYIHNLEEWIIRALTHFGVKGERREGKVGIWVVSEQGRESKIAAIGVRVRHWIAYHGIAINVDPDLSHFNGIVPCGIHDSSVTSLRNLGIQATMAELDAALKEEWASVFEQGKIHAGSSS